MNRCLIVIAILGAIIGSSGSVHAAHSGQQGTSRQEHIAWVSDALKRMQTVKVGMTRADLLKVFTTEGGLSAALRRTFVSRDCPYFKVEVVFTAAGRPSPSSAGRVIQVESDQDVIAKISTPYLQFSIMD